MADLVPFTYNATFQAKAVTGARVMSCSLGFGWNGIGDPPTAEEAAIDWYGYVTAAGRPFAAAMMMDDYQFLGVVVTLGNLSSDDSIGQKMATISGTLVDSCPPCNCAVVVTKNTAAGGRKNKGRMFWPPVQLNEGAVDQSGNILTATVAIMQGSWNSLVTAVQATDYELLLHHAEPEAPAVQQDPTIITSLTVSSLLGTQRRRMR